MCAACGPAGWPRWTPPSPPHDDERNPTEGWSPAITTHDDGPDGLTGLSVLLTDEREFPDRRVRIDPTVRRARRRRALLIVAVIVLVIAGAVGGYVAWALNAPLPAPAVTSQTPAVPVPPAVKLALPLEGATAVSIAGADAYLGPDASGTWVTAGTNDPRPLASITKLITALVILEAKPLSGPDDPGPTIVFDKADHDLYDVYYVAGATIAEMPTGSSMSLHDALATMLIPSASNYAEAVSSWAFGSQGAFLGAARRWLAQNGLSGTTIVEPTGLNARNTSTPSDLLAIAKIAAANPVIAQIAATASLTLPGPGTMHNTNDLLGSDGVSGLKTGSLGEGNYTLAYTASLDVGTGEPLAVTGAVLGGFSRESVSGGVRALLSSIRSGFHDVEVAERGDDLGSFTTPWGSSVRLIVGKDASIFTWSDTPISVVMDLTSPERYANGEQVGTLTWTAGPNTTTANVLVSGSIEPPTAWWRLTHPSELG